jgi:hypothetical protein
MGWYNEAEKYEKLIEQDKAICDDNYQAKPGEDDTLDSVKKRAYDEAKARYDESVNKRDQLVNKMLSTLKSFMNESIRPNFEDIIQKKLGVGSWIDLRGNEVTTPCGYTLAGYRMCWMFFMRTVFQHDTAEQQLQYMQFCLKKPKGLLTVRVFAGCVGQMNNYVSFLPCLYYSGRATNTTELATKMSEPALAQLILRLVPQKWQTNYNILRNGLPQSLEEVIVFCEGQEMLERSSIPNKPKDSKYNGKRKRLNHGGDSRKKGKKHCDLCAKNNGPAQTHNTDECRRYNPDGSRKQYQKGKSNGDKKTHNNFSQQLWAQQEKIDNLEKKLKRYDKKRSNEETDDEDMA